MECIRNDKVNENIYDTSLSRFNGFFMPESAFLWDGAKLTQSRDQVTVLQLPGETVLPLIDRSYFSKPEWAKPAIHHFSFSISFEDTELIIPTGRAYYSGENIFPGITVDFISRERELIPVRNEIQVHILSIKSSWKVPVGTGKVWYEEGAGAWSRASFLLTLTDGYIGQAKNCVATFVFKKDAISNVCLQCSQEAVDLDDNQIGCF